MTKICECGHKKGLHEDGLDYGPNEYMCSVRACSCPFFLEVKKIG